MIATTILDEYYVLKFLHKIESEFGRRRNEINEPRSIDLDLIDYSNKVLNNKNLIIPHPRAHLRKFVMGPLAEINPYWIHPILKVNVLDILKKLESMEEELRKPPPESRDGKKYLQLLDICRTHVSMTPLFVMLNYTLPPENLLTFYSKHHGC